MRGEIMRAYEINHIVGFEETNLVGNVYYVHYLRWQGRCREMFLCERAPAVLDEIARGLALVTMHCSCDYLAELAAFDEILVRMRLGGITQNRVTMLFDYWRVTPEGEQLVARSKQQIACMQRRGELLSPTPIPACLREALRPYCGV
jgi:enediyne biosynthesis thioesterase